MLANNKFDANSMSKQQIHLLPSGKIIALYNGACVISSGEQKIGGTVIGSTIEQPQTCHLCQKEFPSLMSLQSHIKESHLENKIYRNIITVTNGNQLTMIPAPQQYQMVNAVKIEKDYQEYSTTTVANLNVPVIIQKCDKDKSNVVQVIKQNPVEYHIQQQEHAAQVVASMNQKPGANPFFNSTIKYELQPVQLVTEVYPQVIAEAPKSEDINSQSSVSSPGSVVTQTVITAGPVLSNGETMEKQHKCLVCDKFFTTVGNLNIHLKIHAG